MIRCSRRALLTPWCSYPLLRAEGERLSASSVIPTIAIASPDSAEANPIRLGQRQQAVRHSDEDLRR
ncbi:MAG: hypothetical protein ACRDRK_20790 [Pseudonocardia sp.]